MKKNNKDSTKSKKKANNMWPSEAYMEANYWREKPVPDRFLELLAEEMIQFYSDNKEALFLNDFLWARRVADNDFRRWCKRSKALKKAHNIVSEMLGHRCATLGLFRKTDARLTSRILPTFGKKWKENEEFFSDLRNDSEKQQGRNLIVQMEDLSKTDSGNS